MEEAKLSSTRTSPSDVYRWWLEPLREGTTQYESIIRLLCNKLIEDGFLLSDIGTSEEELKSLRIKGATLAAEELLDRLYVTSDAEFVISRLREELEVAELTLKDFGITEDDIVELRKSGSLRTVREWLSYLRQGTPDYQMVLDWIHEELALGELTLKGIGTAEEEISTLRIKGATQAAINRLNEIREDPTTYSLNLPSLREQLGIAGITLADIGSNEEEIARLVLSTK